MPESMQTTILTALDKQQQLRLFAHTIYGLNSLAVSALAGLSKNNVVSMCVIGCALMVDVAAA
eukprot:9434481-Karenia_brevis.AAC.1